MFFLGCPLSGTTQVSRYQKGKTNLDFTEARDSEWQWHQLGHMQICTSLQTDNHASVKALKANRPKSPYLRLLLVASLWILGYNATTSSNWNDLNRVDFLPAEWFSAPPRQGAIYAGASGVHATRWYPAEEIGFVPEAPDSTDRHGFSQSIGPSTALPGHGRAAAQWSA